MTLSTKLRVVIDTNVLISGIVWSGIPKIIVDYALAKRFIFIISPFILGELVISLERLKADKTETEVIKKRIERDAIKIIPQRKVKICRDSDDNQILDLCLAGRANYLVTGDKDLLALKDFKKTKIVKGKEFLKMIK